MTDDIQFQSFDNYFSGLPAATTPIGTAPMIVFQGGTAKQTPARNIGGRLLLAGPQSYFVAVTGSDSNDGLTPATAWATIQHASDFISSNLDFGGFQVTINIGAGTFVGVEFRSTAGGGTFYFKGAGSASTTVTNNAVTGFGCFSIGVTPIAVVNVDNMSIDCGNTFGGIFLAASAQIQLATPTAAFLVNDLAFINSNPNGNVCVWSTNLGLVTSGLPGLPIKVTGTYQNIIFVQQVGQFNNFASWSMVGTPSFSDAAVTAIDNSTYIASTANTFSGAATGARFRASTDSTIDNSFGGIHDAAGTFFPGNSPGIINAGGQYTGITDYTGNAAGLPTATVKNAKAFVNDSLNPVFGSVVAGGGGVYTPIYADGTNWRWG